MLNVIDNQWKDHLLSMDHLKEGIGLRGYGQKDPLIEYKKESFELFQDMMDRIEDETIRYLFFLQVTTGPPGESGNGGGPGSLPERPKPVLPFSDEDEEDDEDDDNEEALVAAATSEERRAAQSTVENFTRHIQRKKDKEMAELQFAGGDGSASEKKQAVSAKKAGRNDPCPCGSGKKYKKCHGA
jgi:preprotein translocase subunit SecA